MKKTVSRAARVLFGTFAAALAVVALAVSCGPDEPNNPFVPPPPLVLPEWIDSALANTSWMRVDPEAGASMWSFEYKEGDSTGTAIYLLTSPSLELSGDTYSWTTHEAGKLVLVSLSLTIGEETVRQYEVSGDELVIDGKAYARSKD